MRTVPFRPHRDEIRLVMSGEVGTWRSHPVTFSRGCRVSACPGLQGVRRMVLLGSDQVLQGCLEGKWWWKNPSETPDRSGMSCMEVSPYPCDMKRLLAASRICDRVGFALASRRSVSSCMQFPFFTRKPVVGLLLMTGWHIVQTGKSPG